MLGRRNKVKSGTGERAEIALDYLFVIKLRTLQIINGNFFRKGNNACTHRV